MTLPWPVIAYDHGLDSLAQAAELRHELLGDWHTGPRVQGDLGSAQVRLVWRSRPRFNPRPGAAR